MKSIGSWRHRFAGPAAALVLIATAGAGEPPAESTALADLARQAEQELHGNILPFWLQHARRPDAPVFHAFIGEDMGVRDDLPRGALLTCRILWTFSAAYRQRPDPEYLEMARFAFRDLMDHFRDREHGGIFWSVGPESASVDARKQIYLEAFAIYGLSEYYLATQEPAALEEAKAIFALLERHAYDSRHGGYFDALDRQWRRPPTNDDNVLGVAPKSQNSHIHILEAFTNLLRAWPDPILRQRHRELIALILDRVVDARSNHLILFMAEDWTPIGDEVSYGHDIELSWLLVEAAEIAGDPALLARSRATAVGMADATLQSGLDDDGAVLLKGNRAGPTNFNKEWWEQAEAVVGFTNAFQISGDARHLRQAVRSWEFIQRHVVDRKNGDWHNTLRRDRTPILSYTTRSGETIPHAKLSVWKCPYHNSRMCLELIARARHATAHSAAP